MRSLALFFAAALPLAGCVQYELTVPSATAVARVVDADGELRSTAALPFPTPITFDGSQSTVDTADTPASDFSWTWYEVPEDSGWDVGSSDGFEDAHGESTEVTPPVPGAYMARLQVSGETAGDSSNLAVATGFAVNLQGLEFRLTWDTDSTDMDLHVINGAALEGNYWTYNDCYFGNPTPDWGLIAEGIDNPSLVEDVDSGYGPESINIVQPAAGNFAVAAAFHNDWDTGVAATPEVSVWFDGQILHTFPGTAIEEGQVVFLGTLQWPAQIATDDGSVLSHLGLGGDPYNET